MSINSSRTYFQSFRTLAVELAAQWTRMPSCAVHTVPSQVGRICTHAFHKHTSSKQSGDMHRSVREVTESLRPQLSADLASVPYGCARLLPIEQHFYQLLPTVWQKLFLHNQSLATFLVFIVEQRKIVLYVEECCLPTRT